MTPERCPVTGKIIHVTRASAEARIAAINKNKQTRDYRGDCGPGKLQAYKCQFCNHFHTGHFQTKRTKRDKIRFDPIYE